MEQIIRLSINVREIFLSLGNIIFSLLNSSIRDFLPSITELVEGFSKLFSSDMQENVSGFFDLTLLDIMFGSGLTIFVVLTLFKFLKSIVKL